MKYRENCRKAARLVKKDRDLSDAAELITVAEDPEVDFCYLVVVEDEDDNPLEAEIVYGEAHPNGLDWEKVDDPASAKARIEEISLAEVFKVDAIREEIDPNWNAPIKVKKEKKFVQEFGYCEQPRWSDLKRDGRLEEARPVAYEILQRHKTVSEIRNDEELAEIWWALCSGTIAVHHYRAACNLADELKPHMERLCEELEEDPDAPDFEEAPFSDPRRILDNYRYPTRPML